MKKELIQKRKEQELERIIRKKIELEKVIEQKKQVTNMYRQINTELEVIKEERENREMNNVKLLEKALNRANVFRIGSII